MGANNDKEVFPRGKTDSVTESGPQTDMASGDNDPQKAATTATPLKSLQNTVTAQDWSGPDDPENPLNW